MRNGKLAHLGHDTIQALNQRLQKNESSTTLLEWLNALPEVQETIKTLFDNVPISRQNLHEWRKGGFREWEMREDLIRQATAFNQSTRNTAKIIPPSVLAEDLIFTLTMHYVPLLHNWDGKPDPKTEQKQRLLRNMLRDVALMQKTIIRAAEQRSKLVKVEIVQLKNELAKLRSNQSTRNPISENDNEPAALEEIPLSKPPFVKPCQTPSNQKMKISRLDTAIPPKAALKT